MIIRPSHHQIRSLNAKLAEHVPGEVLLKLKPDVDDRLVSQLGGKVAERISLPGRAGEQLLRVELPQDMSTAEALLTLQDAPGVQYAASNDIVRATGPVHPKLWALDNFGQNGGKAGADISATEAWQTSTGSRQGPIVAVVDSGVDFTHPNLAANIWTNPEDGSHGYNAIDGSHNAMDDDSHGTHCAGTIAAQGQDGVYGVNWQARVMPIKFLKADGSGKTSDAIKGIAWAAEHGARIVNNSWGGTRYNEAMRDALAGSPCLHVFAAGNENENNDAVGFYPASYDLPNLIAVAGSDRRDQKGMFSNIGVQSVHLAAPGVEIYSTVPGGGYASQDGTSMAAPHVAGALALVAAAYPEASNDQIRQRVLESTDALPEWKERVSSGGRLNLARALKADSLAPGAPTELSASAEPGRARLSLVCSGDDGAEGGPAARHHLSYSSSPEAPGVSVKVARPADPGQPQELSFPVPFSEEPSTLYLRHQVSDAAGNFSPAQIVPVEVPAAVLAFQDRNDPGQWIAEGSWGLEEVPGRGLVWSDSPSSTYSNNLNSSLTSQPVSLSGLRGARLSFEKKCVTEEKYDGCAVEVSADGSHWKTLEDTSGKVGWTASSYDLSAYDGQTVQFRFRLHTDNSGYRDGVYFDNVAISGQPLEAR